MFRFLVFILIVLGLALLFAWVADNPGGVYLEWEWLATRIGRPGEEVGLPLIVVVIAYVISIAIAIFIAGVLKGIFGMPRFISRFFDNRRREKGYRALSRGLIAASAGDIDMARSLTKESRNLLKDEPLVTLLGTQTALLEGNREAATQNFKTMLDNEDTRMVALRGLFLEAERQGKGDAARHYAEEAAHAAPALPWAGNAKLRYAAADGDWEAAIATLEANRSAGLIEKSMAKRHRAVLLTAKAMSVEQANPEQARKLAKEAHKLAKDLVPAAVTYARAATRLGDIRGASKVLEASWKQEPHPEVAEAYATVRVGDSVQDRLTRAKKLAKLRPNHPEGSLAMAAAYIDAQEWDNARTALESVLTTRPTERACLLMADIEEGQYGDQGRMRDWLSRAVRAPADEAWTADGIVSEEWLPISPVSGEIDAFEWKVPVAQLGGENAPVMTLEELKAEAAPIITPRDDETKSDTLSSEEKSEDDTFKDTIEDAVIVSDEEPVSDKETKPETQEAKEEASTPESSESITASKPEQPEASKPDQSEAIDAEKNEKAPESKTGTIADNVVSLEKAKAESAAEKSQGNKNSVAASTSQTSTPNKTTSPYENQIKGPLDRRPDDPGPHPDKEPPKKGFKLF